mgnify:CR=1 FL=1
MEFGARMERLVRNGGFCAVNIDPRCVERAEHQLVHQHGFELVDLDTVLIEAMRKVAKDSKVEWPVVARADSDSTAPGWRQLQSLVRTAIVPVREHLLRVDRMAAERDRLAQEMCELFLHGLATPSRLPPAGWGTPSA